MKTLFRFSDGRKSVVSERDSSETILYEEYEVDGKRYTAEPSIGIIDDPIYDRIVELILIPDARHS